MTALVRMGVIDQDVLDVLGELAHSDEAAVRYRVASGLAGSPANDDVTAVIAGLAGDPDPAVRKAAVMALAGRTDAAALEGAKLAWEAGKEAQEGPAYEAALKALTVAARVDDEAAGALLVGALDSDNWAYVLEAALGILERNVREQQSRPAA